MSQMGFFDADNRLSMLSLKGDPLEAISKLVPREMFRADIEAVVLTADEVKKSHRSTVCSSILASAQTAS